MSTFYMYSTSIRIMAFPKRTATFVDQQAASWYVHITIACLGSEHQCKMQTCLLCNVLVRILLLQKVAGDSQQFHIFLIV